jgi:hypothetical protein
MYNTAAAASPLSYSQACDTFRPRCAVIGTARRAGLGRTAFVHFFERGAVRNRFVTELVSEGRPGRVIDALCHPGSGKFRGGHIANRDVIEPAHYIERKFVLKIGARVRDFGVQLRDMPLVLASALRFCQLPGCAAAESVIGQFLARREGREVLQLEVNANAALHRASGNIGDFDGDIEEPVAACVLCEVGPILDLPFGKRAAAEYAERVACEAESVALTLEFAPLERHPSKALTTAITQVWPFELAARLRVLLARRVDRSRVDSEFFAATRRQTIEVESSWPFLVPLERVLLCVVAEVPDMVNRAALLVQQAVQRLHAVTVHLDQRFLFNAFSRENTSYLQSGDIATLSNSRSFQRFKRTPSASALSIPALKGEVSRAN